MPAGPVAGRDFWLMPMQARNNDLVTCVNRFFETRDVKALSTRFGTASTGERTMLLGYLLASDFAALAQQLCEDHDFDLVRGLANLDRENGKEFARQLGWA
jgi:hypothetical protein